MHTLTSLSPKSFASTQSLVFEFLQTPSITEMPQPLTKRTSRYSSCIPRFWTNLLQYLLSGEIVWENWRKLKNEHQISMRVLITWASIFLAQQLEQKQRIQRQEGYRVVFEFLQYKKMKLEWVASFCTIFSTMKFSTWATHTSRVFVRDDP